MTLPESEAVRVVVNTPAKSGLFDYAVPPELSGALRPGQRVLVPFNHRIHQGVIWATGVTPEVPRLKAVLELIEAEPVLTEAQLALAKKISERFLSPLQECVNLLLTEKIRRVSRPVYRLSGIPAPRQQGLPAVPGAEADRESLLRHFEENSGTLDEKSLDKAFGKKQWQRLMEELIREGLVRKEYVLDTDEGPGPRSRVTVILSNNLPEIEGMNFSKSHEADRRRRTVLETLKEKGGELFRTELTAAGAKKEDLDYLEKRGWVRFGTRDLWRDHRHFMREPAEAPVTLTPEQQQAVDSVVSGLHRPGETKPILLHGVTGSGKTEVYLRAAAEAIRMGKQVLMLVPEIALTPQIHARFERRFPGLVGVYHSGLSEGERYDTWRRGRNGMFRVIVGPRSAFSVPLPDLGLILVDECHENSYYQTGERPYYSAVRAASDYAEITGAQLVLGSATPTTAQMFKAERSGWQIITLKNRATGVKPPRVMLADMRAELKAGNSEIFSRALVREIGKTLEMGKQVILFLNRRGTASYTFCHDCGAALKCPECDIPFTWHASRNRLECHYCGKTMPLPEHCPECGSEEIRQFGAGVELVEAMIAEKFPEASVIRVDADTTGSAGSHEKLLTRFAAREADILVGTQMVARGLDFPGVRLVGILLADVGANFHDYRVDEHIFQMLTQVAGRAGRASEQGLAILQTFQPDRYSIRASVSGDYTRFYENDLKYRRMMGYPPFTRMLRLEIRDADPDTAVDRAEQLAAWLKNRIQSEKLKLRLIGPAPCYFPKLGGKYRWHVILRGADPARAIRGLDLSTIRAEVDPPTLL